MYIADLHTHSRYSRATSKECTPEYLDLWARRKGIHLIGSGDFTHPAWREELKEKLKPAEDGFYVLKKEYRIQDGNTPDHMIPRFVITGEISSIYKKCDKVRKVHSSFDPSRAKSRRESFGETGSDRKSAFGRAADSWVGLPGFTGNHAGDNTRWHVRSGTHLDTAFFHVRSIFRI